MSTADSEARSNLPEARILLADDSPINQTVARCMLQHLGVTEVDVAEHGRAAVDLASRHDYDLILMDCQMPIMDGYEATRLIRQSSAVPIVAVSGRVLAEDREQCRDHGMDDCLGKPFELSGLHELLARWLVA